MIGMKVMYEVEAGCWAPGTIVEQHHATVVVRDSDTRKKVKVGLHDVQARLSEVLNHPMSQSLLVTCPGCDDGGPTAADAKCAVCGNARRLLTFEGFYLYEVMRLALAGGERPPTTVEAEGNIEADGDAALEKLLPLRH